MTETTFTSNGGWAGKVQCDVCGREGYGSELKAGQMVVADHFYPWQLKCLNGHKFACVCGKRWPGLQSLVTHIRRSRGSGVHARAH